MSRLDDRDRELAEALTEEAKALWAPRPIESDEETDAERALFARIDAHEADVARRAAGRSGASFWGPVAFITAVAAGVLLFSHPQSHDPRDGVAEGAHPSLDSIPAPSRPTAPAALTAIAEGGELRVDGVHSESMSLREGERLEARGGVAAFSAPGRVDWVLESGTEVTAVRAGSRGGSIVLALQAGAVEAQVTPVPAGEAFAVDVDGVRVAVHGTHLRVARASRGGPWVVVDLSEGVISVGAPPKAGSTIGVLVNAPAHVEFSVADLDGTLRVDRDPAHVRPPIDPTAIAQAAELPEHAADTASEPASPLAPLAPPAAVANPPTRTARAIAVTAAHPAPPAPPTPLERLTTVVHACADGTMHRATDEVAIRSMMTVDIDADGAAQLTHFDPPLAPDLQACVAKGVYAIRWSGPGPLRIPLELHN